MVTYIHVQQKELIQFLIVCMCVCIYLENDTSIFAKLTLVRSSMYYVYVSHVV